MLSNKKLTCEAYTYTYLETAEQVFLSLRGRPVVLEHVQGRLGRFSALARSRQKLDLEPNIKGQRNLYMYHTKSKCQFQLCPLYWLVNVCLSFAKQRKMTLWST